MTPAQAPQQTYRICEFCNCTTNARQRFCCGPGRDADRAQGEAQASPAAARVRVPEITPAMVTQAAERAGFSPAPGKLTLFAGVLQVLLDRAATEAAIKAAPAEPARQEGEALEEMRARKDAAYLERNQVVAALAKRFPSGVARTAIEGWSEDWHGCVFIDLPTGQASWHFHDSHAHLFAGLPPYKGTWDGHDTPEKYRRLAALASPPPAAAGAQPVAWIRPDVLPWVHHPARFGNPGTEVIMYKSQSRDAVVPVYTAAPQTVPIDAQAARDVLSERKRQMEVEGWSPNQDDSHGDGAMAVAAACYALADRKALEFSTVRIEGLWQWTGWSLAWFKPKDKRRNLVRAGALILAEIERLDRFTAIDAARAAGKETNHE